MNPTSTHTKNANLSESRDLKEATAQKGHEAKESVKQMASDAGHELQARAKEVAETVRGQAEEAGSRIKERGLAYAEKQKSHFSSEVQALSHAAKKASQRLEEESDTNLAEYVANAADYLETASRRISEKDLRSLMDDLERSARRHPEIVFGGLFVVGLAFTRFLKASKPRRRQRAMGRSDNPAYRGESMGHASPGDERPRSAPPLATRPPGLPSAQETHSQGSSPTTNSPRPREESNRTHPSI